VIVWNCGNKRPVTTAQQAGTLFASDDITGPTAFGGLLW